MASLKVVLRTNKQKKDGTSPLALRIIKDRKTRFVFTGQYISEKDWNAELCKVKKSHPNSVRLNHLLLKKITEANQILLDSETASDFVSAKQIKGKIKRTSNNTSFFDIAAERIKSYQDRGVFSVSSPECSIVNNLKKFWGKELYFEDITESFLERYKTHCISVFGHSKRTVTNQLIFIRTVFNIAIKKGYAQRKQYPFGGEKEKIRIGSGLKIGLTKEEVSKIENVILEKQSQIWHTRNVWLFSYYFAGIRISDVLEMKWNDIQDGRLLYVMAKNEKPISLKIPEKAWRILDYYKSDKQSEIDYIFHYMKKANPRKQKDIFVKKRNATRLLNKYLKRLAAQCDIDKVLSNHIARHTFGNIAGDKIHPLMLQKLYRHSDLKTTINYQANFIHKDTDEALDSVIG